MLRRLLVQALKAALLVVLLFLAVGQYDSYLSGAGGLLADAAQNSRGWLLLCVAAMPVNWLLDAWKWKLLVGGSAPVSWMTALRTVLSGIPLALVTPQRLGEYLGRILHADKGQRAQYLQGHIISNLSQLAVLLSGGLLALSYRFDVLESDIPAWLLSCLLAGLSLLILVLLTVLFKPGAVRRIRRRAGFLKRLKVQLPATDLPGQRILVQVHIISVLRYILYVSQFTVILWFLGVDESFISVSCTVALIFLVQTGVPIPALFSFILRGEIAMRIWQLFDDPRPEILVASYLLWCINLLIPGLIGYVVLLRLDILKKMGYES